MKNFSKNIVLWIVIGLLLTALFNLFQNSSNKKSTSVISFSDFIAATEAGNISEVNIRGNNVEGYLDNGRSFTTYAPNYTFQYLWRAHGIFDRQTCTDRGGR